jgi:predicted house-cleaning noncanonical NTP pyrophosphatase (MazG superfamily)
VAQVWTRQRTAKVSEERVGKWRESHATLKEARMGLDDMLKQQIRDRAPELKQKLVDEFSEVTKKDMDETGDDPDEIVDRVQKKTGQPREQVEQRVQKVMQKS